jgi:hypothetical protein
MLIILALHISLSMERPLAPSTPNVRRTDSQSFYWRPSAYLREQRLCRYVLVVLSVMIVVGTVIGIIFVAHYYFNFWGGHGFLKARKLVPGRRSDERPQSCLPLRSIWQPIGEINDIHGFDHSGVKRSPSTLPFYPCGDQQNSCEAYSQVVNVVSAAFVIPLS